MLLCHSGLQTDWNKTLNVIVKSYIVKTDSTMICTKLCGITKCLTSCWMNIEINQTEHPVKDKWIIT